MLNLIKYVFKLISNIRDNTSLSWCCKAHINQADVCKRQKYLKSSDL